MTSTTSGSKYKNKKETIDGITFDSVREANRYIQLRQLQEIGAIVNLRPSPEQPKKQKFWLHVPSTRGGSVVIGSLTPDFTYVTREGEQVVEDAKGLRTALYAHKKRHCEAEYGVVIRDV